MSDLQEGLIGRIVMSIGAIGTATVAALVLGATLLIAPAAAALPPGCQYGSTSTTPCSPAWTITSVSEPTNFAPGDSSGHDEYVVTAINSGGAATDGTPITLTDSLPSGLTLDSSVGASWVDDNFNSGACSVGPQITCTDPNQLQPGQGIVMAVPVDVAAGPPSSVINSAAVTGGGAAQADTSQRTTISAVPAPFGVLNFASTVTNADGSPGTQAGTHPYELTTSFAVTSTLDSQGNVLPAASVKDINVALPPGLIGDPAATPRCTKTEFNLPNFCPADTQVGLVTIIAPTTPNTYSRSTTFPVYNLVPPPGMPAQFGFQVVFDPVFIDTAVRTGGDYGVTAHMVNTSQVFPLMGTILTLWGVPGDPSHNLWRCTFVSISGCSPPNPFGAPVEPLLTMPTACSGPLTTNMSADTWESPGSFLSTSFASQDSQGNPTGLTGCNQLGFSPTITAQPQTTVADSPTGLTVDVHMPQDGLTSPTGTGEAALKDAVVTLPPGVTANASAADGLGACSPNQIGLDNTNEPTCPDDSKVGSVEIDTPLLSNPLTGSVYLAQQGNNPFGSLLALYVTAHDPASGVLIKLAGHVVADPVTGQLTTTFDNNPQLPFSDFKLNFYGGPRAVLATPESCGTFATTSDLTPWSAPESGPDAMPFAPFTIDSGCTMGFSPAFTAGTVSNAAGSFSPFVLSFSRNDAEQQVKGLTFTLPPGVSAKLAGVPECPDANANAGTCPEASRIGSVTVASGVGPDPFVLKGSVYLTGPYNGGPFGEVVVVPAVAGPFNLGNVVVRGSIRIDPHTAQPTVVSDPFPQFVGQTGIPTDVERVDVTLDRPGFTFNPTSCAELKTTGTLASTQGTSANVSQRFEASECRSLPFKPGFKVRTRGRTSRKGGASLHVTVTSGPGQANIAYVHVTLPRNLPSRLETLRAACFETTFAASPASCPAASRVGTAVARTPLLANPLSGPVYFVSHGAAAFPDVVAVLQGEEVTIDLVGQTSIKKNITSTTFASVPDVPITRFDMDLPQGPHSALAAFGSLCKLRGRLTMPTVIRGQNGALSQRKVKIAVDGCPKAGKVKAKRRKHK